MECAISIEDFEKICRTCLKFNNNLTGISLYNIVEMIKSCSSVQVYIDDELPSNLCEPCFTKLQIAYDFKHLCEDSDKKLRCVIENEGKRYAEKINKISELATENEIKLESVNDDYKTDYQCIDEIVKDETEYSSDFVNEDNGNINEDTEGNGDKYRFERIQSKDLESVRKVKRNSKKYECEICQHKFSETWKLGIHMKRIHHAKGTKCSRCSFICYHKLHLEVHERSHVEIKVYCKVCNKGFINKRKLNYHKLSHSTERPHHCTQCDLSFKARFILTKHIKTVHVSQECEVCQICGKNVRKSYLERHLEIHEERSPYSCSECTKKFSLQKSLEIHFKRVHQNESLKYSFLCNICGRGVVSRSELKRHIRSHTGEKPFACDKCDKRYARTGALNHHIKSAHLDERPYVCTVCSQAFHSKNILINHMRKHTGERPYTCLVCGKSFGFRCVLKTHMKIHAT